MFMKLRQDLPPSLFTVVSLLLLGCLVIPGVAQQSRRDFPPDEIVAYRIVGGATLSLHVFKPADWAPSDHRPALVLFFGGGWTHGTPEQFYPQARYLAGRGLVVFSAEYRVKDVHGTDPFACVSDAKAAVRWVRTHARELGVDENRVGAGGGSAGGHLAAATAFLPGLDEEGAGPVSCIPDALVLYNPVVDNGPGSRFAEKIGDRYPEFSPLHNIGPAISPPTAFFIGTEDKLVPLSTGYAFAERVRASGGRCDLHLYEGSGHGFFNHQTWSNLRYYETLRATERFLVSLGWIEGEPALAIPADAKRVPPPDADDASSAKSARAAPGGSVSSPRDSSTGAGPVVSNL